MKMDKKLQQKIENFAGTILRKYFGESDVEFLISTFADDIVWLGAGQEQKAEGKEEVAAVFLAGKEYMIPCDFFEERFVTRELAGGYYLCQEDSILQSKPEYDGYTREHQRVTFIFREKGDSFETLHIHNSVSYRDIQNTELFAIAAAKENYRKLEDKIKELLKIQQQEQAIENYSLRAAITSTYGLIVQNNLTQNTFSCFVSGKDPILIDKASKGKYDEVMEANLKLIHPSYKEIYKEMFEREAVLSCFEKGETERYLEYQALGQDQEYHWLSKQLIKVENPYNEDVLAIELIKALDEQLGEKRRQDMLLRNAVKNAEAANRAKSEFLSRMSHDIRTPLNAIMGMTTIAKINFRKGKQVEECLHKIEISSNYLLSLINDILDMTKIETGKMQIEEEEFEIDELLDRLNTIMEPQAKQNGIEYKCTFDMVEGNYYIGDALRLQQILMNLLSNALKFTKEEGHVSLTVEETKHARGVSYLRFEVKDDGMGIAEEFKSKLFQPFEQETAGGARNNAGSGLGLSIVMNLVQLMGGNISVESEKGKGTTFFINIPFRTIQYGGRRENRSSRGEKTEEVRFSQEKVLLVEDNELNLEIARAFLEMLGLQVDCAENGIEAIEKFQYSEVDEIKLILMDIRMPLMDGLMATRLIRQMDRADAARIPIVAMTADAFEEDRLTAREAGTNFFITKPIDIKQMKAVLEEAIFQNRS